MPLVWSPLFQTSTRGIAVCVTTATMRGRSVYSLKIGKLRDDDSIASFVPVDFRQDDGHARGPINLATTLADVLSEASAAINTHAAADDAQRIAGLVTRDENRAAHANTDRNSTVGKGLSRFKGKRGNDAT